MSRWGRVAVIVSLLAAGGCAPRVVVATGTTLGIKATPGDGQTRPPQLVVGYKRAEATLIPVEGDGAKKKKGSEKPSDIEKDAPSVVSSFYLKSRWTSDTEVRSFIGTGFAAQNIVDQAQDRKSVDDPGSFGQAFKDAAEATLKRPR
jgi:hypothetical protein